VQDLVADLVDCEVDGRPVWTTPRRLRRLGEVAVRIKVPEVLCQRSISVDAARRRRARVGQPSQERVGRGRQELAALAFDVLGGHRRWSDRPTDGAFPHNRGRHNSNKQERHRDAGPRLAAP